MCNVGVRVSKPRRFGLSLIHDGVRASSIRRPERRVPNCHFALFELAPLRRAPALQGAALPRNWVSLQDR